MSEHVHGPGCSHGHSHDHGHGHHHHEHPKEEPAKDETSKKMEVEEEEYPRNLSEKDIADGWKDISSLQDGGLRKKILKAGKEGPKPPKNSEVTCHYHGTLTVNGKKFDSSVERGEPFKFKIGTGGVIKGWDVGIGTMNIGEKCILRCAPDYGYGERGAGNDIPPNAWLDFEVELLSFDDWDSFSNNYSISNDDIKKRIVSNETQKDNDEKSEEEDDDNCPEDECIANVSFLGKHGDNFSKVFASGGDMDIVIDDNGEYPLGFLECIKELKVKEEAEFKILNATKYGFGKDGNKSLGIGENENLYYKIKLNSFKKPKEKADCSSKEKIERSLKYKKEGNDAFKTNKFDRAISKYEKAVEWVDDSDNENDDEKNERKNIKIACFNNQSLLYFKKNDNAKSIEFATKVLEIDEKNLKALLRRGQAKLQKGDWVDAKKDFQMVLDFDNNNVLGKKFLNFAKQKIKKYNDQQKALYSNMFKPKPKTKKEKKDEKPQETNKKMDVDKDAQAK